MSTPLSSLLIFYPVLSQVVLTFVLLYATGRVRLASIRQGHTKIKDIALGQNAWPERATRFANTYNSQFQLPLLFYAVIIFAQIGGQVDRVMIVLAWGFVATRLAHAWIYVTSNNIRQRFLAFVAGFAVLAMMWAYLAFTVVRAGS
jgi:hypothetical protein